MDFKDAVYADAKMQSEQHRQSKRFLEQSVEYDRDRRFPEQYRSMLDPFYRDLCDGKNFYKSDQKKLDLEVLLANLLGRRVKAVSISLTRKDWKVSRYSKVGYFTLKLVKLFMEKGLIVKAPGYHNEMESRYSRIWRTDTLLKYFPILPQMVTYDSQMELVILRDEKGKPKEYRDTAETYRIRKILKRVNEVNAAAKIEYKWYILNAYLRAIFVRKFSLYGRLHTKGFWHYQGLNEDERAKITINGDPVEELDYSAFHPNLLYVAEGMQYEGDPYQAACSDPRARQFLKQLLLIMLNAKNRSTAKWTAREWLDENPSEWEPLMQMGITNIGYFMDRFIKVHQPIAHHFCRGKETGLRLMNKDSKIALAIVKSFADDNIPILAVHDSFLVQRQYRDRLLNVMREAYRNQTGGFECPVK